MIAPISILDKISNEMHKCRFEFLIHNYPNLVLEVTIRAMKFYKHAKIIEQ